MYGGQLLLSLPSAFGRRHRDRPHYFWDWAEAPSEAHDAQCLEYAGAGMALKSPSVANFLLRCPSRGLAERRRDRRTKEHSPGVERLSEGLYGWKGFPALLPLQVPLWTRAVDPNLDGQSFSACEAQLVGEVCHPDLGGSEQASTKRSLHESRYSRTGA